MTTTCASPKIHPSRTPQPAISPPINLSLTMRSPGIPSPASRSPISRSAGRLCPGEADRGAHRLRPLSPRSPARRRPGTPVVGHEERARQVAEILRSPPDWSRPGPAETPSTGGSLTWSSRPSCKRISPTSIEPSRSACVPTSASWSSFTSPIACRSVARGYASAAVARASGSCRRIARGHSSGRRTRRTALDRGEGPALRRLPLFPQPRPAVPDALFRLTDFGGDSARLTAGDHGDQVGSWQRRPPSLAITARSHLDLTPFLVLRLG